MSYSTQLLEYFLDLEDALDEGNCVDAVYLGCRKAFDTVPHKRLLAKLNKWAVDQKLSERQETEGTNQRNIFNLKVSVEWCPTGQRTWANSVPYLRQRLSS